MGDMANDAVTGLCGVIPSTGIVLAPLGAGAEVGMDWGAVCANVATVIHSTLTFVNEQYTTARQLWKEENDAADSCGDLVEGQMYKVFCDMHCIEDAVVKGNSAVLRSLKTMEGHVLNNVHDMLKFYTTEVFDKVKETQAQINHNDGQLSGMMNNYVGQMMDQNTEYRDSLADQLNIQINALNTNIGTHVVDPLSKIQNDIVTTNDNIMQMGKWLQSNEVLNPPGLLQEIEEIEETPVVDSNLTTLHTSLRRTHQAVLNLVHSVHRDGVDTVNEQVAVSSLQRLHGATRRAAHHAKNAMREGRLSDAKANVRRAIGAVQQAHAELAEGGREPVPSGFQRRVAARLVPAQHRLLRETLTTRNAHRELLAFQATQRAIMGRHESLHDLGEQIEASAAADMMVRFDAEARRSRQSLENYLGLARKHVEARSAAIAALHEHSALDTCTSPESLRGLGVHLVSSDRAERRHIAGLARAWRETAGSLCSMTDILVDGGLLLHQIRAAARAPMSTSQVGPDIASAVMLLEAPLHKELSLRVGDFASQLSRGFNISQMLSRMWADAFIDAPAAELHDLRRSWSRLRLAARELRTGLRGDGQLRRDLLIARLQAEIAQSLPHRFPAPPACNAPGAALWRYTHDGSAAVLLSTEGGALWCDLSSGKMKSGNNSMLSLHPGDIGTSLASLI